MSNHNHLCRAERKNRTGVANDEFYTPYEKIEAEFSNYAGKLAGKTVYCPCDDWKKSNFVKYFLDNFEKHGLKKLMATSLSFSGRSVGFEYDGKIQKIHPLDCNGDFRSEECREIMKNCDVVATNPPFSLVSKFVLQILEFDKKYLLVGPILMPQYPSLFIHAKDQKILPGYSGRFSIESDVSGTVAACSWWQNFGCSGRSCPSTRKFSEMQYEVFDERPDIINVDKVKDIPMDYDGLIGAPSTFLLNWNPDEFEVLGRLGTGGFKGYLGETLVAGKYKFSRIVIKRKHG